MYKQGAGVITMMLATTMGDRLIIPILMIIVGAMLMAMGKGEE